MHKTRLCFSKTAHSFISSKYGCNLCADENLMTAKKKTPEWFRNELKSINPNVEQISEYIRMQEKVKVKCVHCGNIFESRAQDLLQGHFVELALLSGIKKILIFKKNTIRENAYMLKIMDIDYLKLNVVILLILKI